MNKQYKIQYFENGYLIESDWMDISIPIVPQKIVSFWFKEEMTKDEFKEFAKQFVVNTESSAQEL